MQARPGCKISSHYKFRNRLATDENNYSQPFCWKTNEFLPKTR